METSKPIGCITRSKARVSAGKMDLTSGTVIPRSVSTTSRSRTSRTSCEALRLRAEYEAEKQVVQLKEKLIKKKLELDIAEIEEEERGSRSMCGSSRVEEWLHTEQVAELEHVAEPRAYSPRATSSNRFEPVTARVTAVPSQRFPNAEASDITAADPPLPFTAIASNATASHSAAPPATTTASDILQLADVIMNNMRRRKPEQNYDLPVFDGDPGKWLWFRRAYEKTARTYNEYENTVRLQASLRGAAKYAVEDLLSTGSDPEDIIRGLEEEFGHPNLLLDNVIKKIRSLPPVSESGAELRHMTSAVRNCVYVLKNIKADGYINNPQLTQEILYKLTPGQRLQYGEYAMNIRKTGEDLRISPNLNVVLEFLSHLSKASTYCLPVNPQPHSNRNRNNPAITVAADSIRFRHRGTHRVHTSVDLPEELSSPVTSSYRTAPAPPCTSSCSSSRPGHPAPPVTSRRMVNENIPCVLCKRDHLLPNCDVFATKSEGERWNIVKANKLCFKCLVEQHSRYHCRAKRCAMCRSPHHTLLHFEKSDAAAAASAAPAATVATRALSGSAAAPSVSAAALVNPSAATGVCAESVTSMGEQCNKTLLKILPVSVVFNDNDFINCFALLDDGATVSLIDNSLCNNLSGPTLPLKIISASGHIINDVNSRRVTALIRGPNGVIHNIKLRTIETINLPPQSVPARVFATNKHLRELGCREIDGAKPLILIGQDNWELIVNQEIRQGKSGQPVASHTRLGWVVHGPLGVNSQPACGLVNIVSDQNDKLFQLVKEQFELESIGIAEVSRKNAETERACNILRDTSRRVDSGWEVGLLWARDEVFMPNNYSYALKRLCSVENKMDKNIEYAAAYTAQVERLLSERYARLVKSPVDVKPVWCLPHFGVTNPNKPNKLRLVYDAAAKYQGTCLNDQLLTGPDLLNSILGVLFRFRSGPIAYSADIADMFLRIKIRKADRGAQLFLWRGKDRGRDPDVYVMDSMIFGAKSSPSSAIYILNKNADEFRDSYPEAVQAIHNNHYMDDYLDSVLSVEKARQLIKDVSMIHAAGGFSIRGWVTNSPKLRESLPTVVPGKVNFDKSPNSAERTLGMIWLPESDELAFDLSFKRLSREIVDGRVVPTKREFLKFIMSIFDPLGLLCPYTIKSKILLQKVWRSGIEWDERLKENESKEWERWLQDIKELNNMRIPRWYGLSMLKVDLHVFGDASELAYSAVAYLVSQDGSEKPAVALVAGKARVAPLKVVSIPRLELQAAVLACRLANTVEKEQGLPIGQRYLWSDSKTVLKWIHADPRDFQKFVSHRLAEIDSNSNINEWRWVPSADNPADVATKMHRPANIKLWLKGPSFLSLPIDQWPVNEYDDGDSADIELIEKVHVVRQIVPLIDLNIFSSWIRAVRVTARVIAFSNICRKKQSVALTANNIRDAEVFLYKQSQSETFFEERKALGVGCILPPSSKIRDLDPFLYEGDGLLRVRGRLSAAPDLMFDEKHPIILDGRNTTAQLIVLHYHKRVHHANHDTVLNSIREKFWITQSRRTIKSVVSKCQFCRIRRALPSFPKMADLPAARLTNTRRAFVHCGIDYFGPLEVSVGRRREKRWGVIFTCLVTRGVHIELAASLSADSAIMAIRRFVARRGEPSIMFSDRGTNFVGANAELKAALRALDHNKISDSVMTKGIVWKFNPPGTPHMGGSWERLIRSIKAALGVTLNERAPREEVLNTLLAEVEMTINSRPLTYVSPDANGPVQLTPNHLLIGTASGSSTLGAFDPSDLNGRKAWRKAQSLADMFWRRWLREYVPTLQTRQKWRTEGAQVKIGDVVLLCDPNQPRNTWPKGVISAVHPGRDGHVRVVTVKTSCGRYVQRSVVKVAVLPTDVLV